MIVEYDYGKYESKTERVGPAEPTYCTSEWPFFVSQFTYHEDKQTMWVLDY